MTDANKTPKPSTATTTEISLPSETSAPTLIQKETSGYIPTSFQTVEKPKVIENASDLKVDDKDLISTIENAIAAKNTIKLFKLSNPVVTQEIDPKYKEQHELIIYRGSSMTRVFHARLDKDFKVIKSEPVGAIDS